ncbi:hypothetical protein [Moraxella lacunata]
MYFAIKSTPKVSVSNFWGAVQRLPLFLLHPLPTIRTKAFFI